MALLEHNCITPSRIFFLPIQICLEIKNMTSQTSEAGKSNTCEMDGKLKSSDVIPEHTSENPFLENNYNTTIDDSNECIEQKRIVRQSTFLAVGAVGIFAAYSGVLCLQSSLNFDDSLGTTSMSLCFITTIILNATLVPLLLQVFGAKFLLLVSDAAFVVFTFANLYPTKWTMYPGAIILGVAESIIWPSVVMFNARFGLISATYDKKGAPSNNNKLDNEGTAIWEKTRWFTGRFFAIFAVHQIIGNLISYAILVLDNIDEDVGLDLESRENNTDVSPNLCGAKDCYSYADDGNLTSQRENLDVKNVALRYGLFAAYAIIQIISFIIHKVLLEEPNPIKSKEKGARLSFKTITNYQWKICRHMTSPLQALIAPINIYNGMTMGFIFGDLTRSFVSCPIGVEQVGLAIAITGAVATFGSVLFQRLSGIIGRNAFFGIAMVMDVSLLVFCLFWEPTSGANSWQIYFVVALFGFPDSIKQAAIAATYPEYFVGKESVAFSMMSLFSATGLTIMFGIGTSICVYTKIIILLTIGTFSTLCYCGAEFYFYKTKQKERRQQNMNDRTEEICNNTL